MRILFTYALVGRGDDAVQVQQMAEALQSLGHAVRLIGPEPLRPYEFGTSMSKARSLARWLPWWAKDALELALNRRLLGLARGAVRREQYDLLFHRASIYDFVGAQGDGSRHEEADRPSGSRGGLHRLLLAEDVVARVRGKGVFRARGEG